MDAVEGGAQSNSHKFDTRKSTRAVCGLDVLSCVVVIVVVYASVVTMGGGETDRLETGRRNRGLLGFEAVEDLPFFEALGGRAIVCGT